MRKILLLICFPLATSLPAQWATQNSGTSAFLTNVFFPTADVGYITKEDGGVLKTTNGGVNWSLKNGANTAWDLFFISADTGILVIGNNIKKTTDGGSNWIVKLTDNGKFFSQVFFVNKNIGYIIAMDNSFNYYYTYKTMDSGENWSLQGTPLLGGNPEEVFFTDSNTGYLAAGWMIYKTIDGGINWAEQYFDSTAFTEIASVFFPSPDTGYAVGSNMYRTFDAGATWALQPTPDGNPLYSVFFLTKNVGFVVGGDGLNSGSVYKTNDAGNSWFQSSSQVQTFNSVYFPNDTLGYAVGDNGSVIKYNNQDSVPFDTNLTNTSLKDFFIFNSKCNLYPNPSNTGRFALILKDKEKQTVNISVTNIVGKKIYEKRPYFIGTQNKIIDLSDFPKGIYFVTVQTGEEFSVHKIVYSSF